MKKKIFAGIYLIISFLKFSLIKVFHIKTFKFSPYSLFSPFTSVEIAKKGKLSLGKKIQVRSGSKIAIRKNGVVCIGDNSFLNYRCMVICHEKIIIGNGVQFGPNVLVYDHDHDFRAADGLKALKYNTSPVKIGNNVWVGANSVILRGTVIGDNCVIGAGTVVKGNYPDNSVIIQDKKTKIISYIDKRSI